MPESVSESNLFHAVASASAPLAILDSKGLIRAASQPLADLLGVASPGEVQGQSAERFVPSDQDRERVRHLLADLMAGTVEAFARRSVVLRPDGQEIDVTSRSRVIRADGDTFALLALTTNGFSELPSVPASTPARPSVFVICDHDWRVVDVSLDGPEILGREFQVGGKALLGLVYPSDAAPFVTAIAGLQPGSESVSLPLRIRTDDHWVNGTMLVARICAHLPPRLACLYTVSRIRTDDTNLDEVLTELSLDAAVVEALPDVALAALRRAVRLHDLTTQQWELVARVMTGQAIPEIAAGVFLSPGTVRNQLTEIYRALGVHSRAQLQALIYEGPG